MKILYTLIFLFLSTYSFSQQINQLTEWKEETLQGKILRRYIHTDSIFNSCQNINIIYLDFARNPHTVAFEIANPRKTTSDLASEAGASLALNGSFFNMDSGEPACFLKKNDTIISVSRYDFKPNYFLNELDDAALATDKNGTFTLLKQPETGGWESMLQYPNIMVTGPLLIWDGEINLLQDIPFNTTRNPRTGVCITEADVILFITVDGRSDQAAGMTIHEFAQIMKSLGCQDGVNLDGGGSTALWCKEKGILNRPSDNKVFDHEGERTVSNIITVNFIEENKQE